MKRGKSKKSGADRVPADEILPEYDFRRARPNKYASRYAKGGIVVTLDPDVAAIFPSAFGGMIVLVDTSVWVDHFRRGNRRLLELVDK